MANNPLRKELEIQAVFKDAQAKQDFEKLKQEMSKDIKLGAMDLSEIKRAFKEIAQELGKELKKAIGDAKRSVGTGRATVAGRTTAGAASFEAEQNQHWAETWRRDQARRREDENFKNKMQKLDAQNQKNSQRQDIQHQKNVEKMKQDFLRDKHKRERETAATIARNMRMGAVPGTAYGQMPSDFTGAMDAFTMARGGGGFGQQGMARMRATTRLAAPIAGVGAGILAAGAGTIDLRRVLAEREFRGIRDVTQGRALEGIARQAGRSEFLPAAAGGVGGAAGGAAIGAGIGSFFGPIGTAVGSLAGGIYGGFRGATTLSNLQGELRTEQIAPLIDAYQRARGAMPDRLALARGGAMGTTRMNMLQRGGVQQGFGPEETIRQALQARTFLGNQALQPMFTQTGLGGGALTNLGAMQQMMQATGVSVGEQAMAAEVFAGAGRGGGGRMTRGVTQQIDVLKKGVAAGLDVSKSGQFLRTTAEFVQQNAGFGKMDINRTSERLAASVAGFAGGGPATTMDIQRAQRRETMLRRESMAEAGFAGIGGISAIQEVLPEATTEQFLAGMRVSATDDPEQVAAAMNISVEEAARLIEAKRGAQARGLDVTGIGAQTPMGFALGARERGVSLGEQFGERMAGLFGGTTVDTGPGGEQVRAALEAVQSTKEFQLTMKEASVANKQVIEGIGLFDVAAAKVTQTTNELNEALKTTKDRLLEMAEDLAVLGNN